MLVQWNRYVINLVTVYKKHRIWLTFLCMKSLNDLGHASIYSSTNQIIMIRYVEINCVFGLAVSVLSVTSSNSLFLYYLTAYICKHKTIHSLYI